MDREKRRLTRKDLVNVPRAINVDQGRAAAWTKFANNMFSMSMQVHDDLDNEARIDGWRKGFSGDVNDPLMFQPTIRGEAFTKQAITSYWTNLEASSRVRIDELAAQHPNDPKALQDAVDEYQRTITATLPPEFAPKAQAYLKTTSRPYVARARKALVDGKIAQAEASMIMAERSAILEIERNAGGLLSSDGDIASSSSSAILATRARLSAMYSSTVEDDLGNKVPVFSPQAKAKAALALEEQISRASILGWVQQTPNKLAALKVIGGGGIKIPMVDDNGQQIGVYNPMANLDMDQRRALMRDVRGEFSAQLSISRSLQAMSDRREKRRDREALVRVYQAGATLGSPQVTRLRAEELLMNTTDPTTARLMAEVVQKRGIVGDPKNSTAYLAGVLRAMDGNFDPSDYQQVWGLDPATVVDLVQKNQVAETRLAGESPTRTARFNDARELINGHVAGMNFETVMASVAAGRDTPELRKALQYEVLLREAVLSDPSVDPLSWVRENVTGVLQEKAGTLRKLTADLKKADDDIRVRRQQLKASRRGGKLTADPTYKSLIEHRTSIHKQIQQANQ